MGSLIAGSAKAAAGGRPIGAAGLALIKRFEGCRLKVYKPVATEKYWTIGWGHYGPDVREGQVITQGEADALLAADCQRFADAVDDAGNCPLTGALNANQRDALISFTYNCGAGCLRTLCRGRTLAEICGAMALYTRAGGVVLPGLARRRAEEQTLFNTPVEEDDAMDIAKLTDREILQLVNRIQEVLGRQPVSAALAAEVEEAAAAGVTDGERANALCTRAQAAAMVMRGRPTGPGT